MKEKDLDKFLAPESSSLVTINAHKGQLPELSVFEGLIELLLTKCQDWKSSIKQQKLLEVKEDVIRLHSIIESHPILAQVSNRQQLATLAGELATYDKDFVKTPARFSGEDPNNMDEETYQIYRRGSIKLEKQQQKSVDKSNLLPKINQTVNILEAAVSAYNLREEVRVLETKVSRLEKQLKAGVPERSPGTVLGLDPTSPRTEQGGDPSATSQTPRVSGRKLPTFTRT